MTRHSRNACAGSVFTYAERRRMDGHDTADIPAGWIAQVDTCFMCMKRAEQPCVCSQGHVGCRECFLSTLLARQKEKKKRMDGQEVVDEGKIDNSQVETFLAQQQVLKETDNHQHQHHHPSRPSAPTTKKMVNFMDEQKRPGCPGGSEPHPLSIKSLHSVSFKYSSLDRAVVCFRCQGRLQREAHSYQPCGHVVCALCTEHTATSMTCPVCGIAMTSRIIINAM